MTISALYVTFPNEEEAKRMATSLLEQRLVACANLSDIRSLYLWQAAVTDEKEVGCLMKTSVSRLESARKKIQELHSYDVPCIVSWEMVANESYGQWVEQSTTPESW